MKTTINIDGENVEITLTPKQVEQINKSKDIAERIKNFKDVLEYLTESDEEVITYRKMLKADISGKSLHTQMAVCWNKALNEKYEFKESDYKYRIWWNWYPFSFDCVSYGRTLATVPLALCFKEERIARYASSNKEYVKTCKKFVE